MKRALLVVGLLLTVGLLAYVSMVDMIGVVDPIEIATTCSTCQDPKPPSPFPVAPLALTDTEMRVVLNPYERAPHPTKPGKCESCHPPYDICLPPCRS